MLACLLGPWGRVLPAISLLAVQRGCLASNTRLFLPPLSLPSKPLPDPLCAHSPCPQADAAKVAVDGNLVCMLPALHSFPRPLSPYLVQVDAAEVVVDGDHASMLPALQSFPRPLSPYLVQVDAAEVVVDGNLVSAPAWPAHPKWLAAFVDLLGYKVCLYVG